MSQEAMMEEEVLEMVQEEVREEGGRVVGSAESDELEAKTQETHHPHQRRQHERMNVLREMN